MWPTQPWRRISCFLRSGGELSPHRNQIFRTASTLGLDGVACDQNEAADKFRSTSIDENVDAECRSKYKIVMKADVRKVLLSQGISYEKNKQDVHMITAEILQSNNIGSVNAILQKWLRKLKNSVSFLNAGPEKWSPVVSYDQAVAVANGLIKQFGQMGKLHITMEVLKWMQQQNWFLLDPHLRINIIHILGKSSCFDIAMKVFGHLIRLSVGKDAKDSGMYNALLNAFSKAGRFDSVQQMFRDMKKHACQPNIISYNIVMHACVKARQELTKVVTLFKEMYQQGIKPDICSYDILLSACVVGKQAKEAQVFFEHLKKMGLVPNVITYSTLISVYTASGNCIAATEMLREMKEAGCEPNEITFSSLIHGFGQEGQIKEAERIFRSMKEQGVKPNVFAYNIMINLYSKAGNHQDAQNMFHQMIEDGIEPTFVSFTSLMYSFKSVRAYREVMSIYDDVRGRSSFCNIYTYTEALDTCFRWDNWPKIVDILNDIISSGCTPTVVTCNVILMGISTKCRDVEDLSVLIDFIKRFETKLFINVRRLLLELFDGDDEVEGIMREMSEVIVRDEREMTILASTVIDAMWTLGWQYRAGVVFRWCLSKGVFECTCSMMPGEWSLDLRRLSVGGSMVALHRWLVWLAEANFAMQQLRSSGSYQENNRENNRVENLEVSRLRVENREGSQEREYDREVNRGGDRKDGGTTELPIFATSLASYVPQRLDENFVQSRRRWVLEEVVELPRALTVVTGWGKMSRTEGVCLVKEAVEQEVRRLSAPFRIVPNLPGRWVTSGDILSHWLSLPGITEKLALSDITSEGS